MPELTEMHTRGDLKNRQEIKRTQVRARCGLVYFAALAWPVPPLYAYSSRYQSRQDHEGAGYSPRDNGRASRLILVNVPNRLVVRS